MKTKSLRSVLCVLLAAVCLATLLSGCFVEDIIFGGNKSEAEEMEERDYHQAVDREYDVFVEKGMSSEDAMREAKIEVERRELGLTREEYLEKVARDAAREEYISKIKEELMDKGMSEEDARRAAYVQTNMEFDGMPQEEAKKTADEQMEKDYLDETWFVRHQLTKLLFFQKNLENKFDEEVEERVRKGEPREEAERAIDIRNKMIKIMIMIGSKFYLDDYPDDSDDMKAQGLSLWDLEPGPDFTTMEGWLTFLDGTWQSTSFEFESSGKMKRTISASPNCNWRTVIETWTGSGISCSINTGDPPLLSFSVMVEIEQTDKNGKEYSEFVQESGYLQVIDEDHIMYHTDRYEGKATETFQRIG